MRITLPRFVRAKGLAKKQIGFYWEPPAYWKKQAEALDRKFPFESQPLGTDLTQTDLDARALPHNQRFDEWREGGGSFGHGKPPPVRRYAAHGTVAWLIESYLSSEMFKRRVGVRSRPDYRRLFDEILSYPTKAGSFGELPVFSVTLAASEKMYTWLIAETVDEERTAEALALDPKAEPIKQGLYRKGEKAMMYLKTAWRIMQPHHPREFRKDVPNPWAGVQLVSYTKKTKAAHGRDDVYAFAWKAIELGRPEMGAAAVICFEWLQRPENVVGGYIRWTGYVPGKTIRVEHHKTRKTVQHPLADSADGAPFYEDAETVLTKLPKRGVPMILRPDGTLYEQTRFAHLVREIADAAGLPKTFSLDACRHGGMTELEEAALTDGQGRALSMHSSKAYDGYAKRTEQRILAATRRRHAYRLAAVGEVADEHSEINGTKQVSGD